MAREITQRGSTVQRVERLPATHWTSLKSVRWPGSADGWIDEVLVGPSGIHVVLDAPLQPASTAPGGPDRAVLEEAAGRAAAAAAAVAELLPDRYRRVVTPAVCLTDAVDVGTEVGAVLAASPGVLRHSWRHRPWVLSTSEVHAVADRLRARLEPFPVEPPHSSPAAWSVRRRLWLAGVVAAAGAAAASGGRHR